MRRAWLWLLGLAVAANAAVLGAVAWNRSAIDATLELTERELKSDADTYRAESGEPVRALQLIWKSDSLDREVLAALGLRCSAAPDDVAALLQCAAQPSREAWVVLEYDGDAWREWRAEQALLIERPTPAPDAATAGEPDTPVPDVDAQAIEQDRLASLDLSESRLFAVDADLDADSLRERYPDRSRYAIVRGQVAFSPTVEMRPGATPGQTFEGVVYEIFPESIHVDRTLARVLKSFPYRDPWKAGEDPASLAPRYRATLIFGARYEPWISQIKQIDEPTSPP